MSQHVPDTCNESNGQWLPLIEYSVKSGVSLSTIRRKIKSNSIRFRLEKGRYLILFNEMNNLAARQPSPTSSEIGDWQNEPLHRLEPVRSEAMHRPFVREDVFEEEVREERATSSELGFAERAVKMVSDAFEHALKEKEERIRMLEKANQELEERLAELRTLVRVLEEKFHVRY